MTTDHPAVPDRYRGVWARTLLQSPGMRDDSSFVRWLQTSRWHADLRVPAGARPPGATEPVAPESLACQQGFCGVTTVRADADGEVCEWHRHVDFQPPRSRPDAGRMVFETPDRLVETGLHADYLEVWQRVPGSTGRYVVLEALPDAASDTRGWLLVAGDWAMRVRPRRAAWPADTTQHDGLADLLRRHPEAGSSLLDFEISFGRLEGDRLAIARSTIVDLEGRTETCVVQRVADDEARVQGPRGATRWRIVEWHLDQERLA